MNNYYIVHHDEKTESMQLLEFPGFYGRGIVKYSEKCDLTNEEYKDFVFNSWERDKYLEWFNKWKLKLSKNSGIPLSKIQ